MTRHEDVVGQRPAWLDYAADEIHPDALRRMGVGGVFRYLGATHLVGNWRHDLTEGEYDRLTDAGIEVIGVYETSTSEFLGGYRAGQQAALNILRDGGDWYNGPYCLTIDQHFTPAQRPAAVQYTEGWLSYITPSATVGYGFGEAIDVFRECGIDGKNWQCGNWSDVRPGVRWYQRNDSVTAPAEVWLNDTRADINDDLTGDDDMALTADEKKILARLDIVADKVLGEFNPADDNRPLPYGTKDDMRGSLLSVEGYCKDILAAVELLTEAAGTGGVAFDYDKFIVKLQDKGLVTVPALDQALKSFAHNLIAEATFAFKDATNPGNGT